MAATDGSPCGDHAVQVGHALAGEIGSAFHPIAVESEASGEKHASVTRIRGLPGVEIVRHAESRGADLVILGRYHRSPEHPRHVGQTSDMVIRRRNGLTLFVPPEVTHISRALLALDGTLRGLGVLAPAGAFLKATRASASAICVIPGARTEGPDSAIWRDPRAERVAALVKQVELDTGPCELVVRWGCPVPEIQRALRETGADLLIIGVRRGGLQGDLGSGYVGRELLRSAPCAVLTVPI